MLEYERVNLKLSSQQIKKLKEAVKSNNGTTLRIGIKCSHVSYRCCNSEKNVWLREDNKIFK